MKTIICIIIITIATSCMNTSESKSKKDNPPHDFFSGAALLMGQAIYKNDIKEIERLVKTSHYNVNDRGNTKNKFTYLGYAVLIDATKAAEELLKLGADVNLPSLENTSSIYTNIGLACDNKNKEMINLLLKYHVNLNPPLDGSPIHGLIIGNVDNSVIELLINKGANINHTNFISGDTPIITSLNIFHFDEVNYFLDKGADPLQVDFSGNSVAFLTQEGIRENRISVEDYKRLKNRLESEFHVKFPVKKERKKGLEESVKRYESLSERDKELLGPDGLQNYKEDKELLAKGVDVFGNSFDSGK